MSDQVDVSVLIPVLDEERHLRETAARMLAQRFDGTFELLFIDGRSRDRSRAILEELAASDPRVRVLENPARRTPQALNIGLRSARGTYVARMDAHTRYPATYLQAAVERLERGDVAHVSGPMLAVGEDVWTRRIALALGTGMGVGQAEYRLEQAGEVEVSTGFAGVWRRELLLEHGGWDEGWPSDQDCELAGRLAAEGGRFVCVPDMAAEYIPRDSLQRLGRQYRTYGRYKIKTLRRHPHMVRVSHLAPPALVVTLGAAVGSPRPLRTLARAGAGLYVGALGSAAARARARAGASSADAAWLPAVWATMHLAYGWGMLEGVRRWGVPGAAFGLALRRAAKRAP